jgi:hypothetical protein
MAMRMLAQGVLHECETHDPRVLARNGTRCGSHDVALVILVAMPGVVGVLAGGMKLRHWLRT